MKCFICSEEIKNSRVVKIFGKCICKSCIDGIRETTAEDVFYSFYRDRIKELGSSFKRR